jgi:hypothetical protein
MVEKKTRNVMEGLELEVLEQHKRYGPAPLTCTRRESGHLPSLSESGLATAHLDELHSSKRQEGGYTPSWLLCTPFPKRAQCGHWFLLLKRTTSAGMHNLLQNAMSDSLEAQPEGESVTVLPPTSDHSIKVFTPTLSVLHQRLTLFRQKTANNMEADNMIANDLPADGASANKLPTAGTTLHNGLTAQHDSVEEERGWVSNMAHTMRKAFSTPTPAPTIPREVCRVYFAPILDKTPVNTPTFFAAVELDMLHKRSGIIWSKASVRGGHLIVVPINKEEHLAHLKARQDIGGKYVAVSWIAETIHKTIKWDGIIPPSPL